MLCTFSTKGVIKSFIIFSVIYLALYLWGDIYISEYMANRVMLDKSKVLKAFNKLCSYRVIEILTFILFVMYIITRKCEFSRKLLYIAITLSVAVLFEDVLKSIFGRARPEAFFNNDVYGMQWFETNDIFSSTPSGHSTRAMALCASLAVLCKNRFLQCALIVFAICQALCRVVLLRHYLSDVLFGMWLGFFVALYIHSVMFKECTHIK